MHALPALPSAPPAERLRACAWRFAACQVRYEAARDGRAVCAFAFRILYEDLAAKAPHNGFDFDDPEWTTRLSVRLAAEFFDAMDTIDAALAATPDDPCFAGVPRPWADAYAAMTFHRSCVLEDLLFGLIAHISFDLPHALAQAGLTSNGQSRIKDFHRINAILAGLIPEVQRAIAHRYNPRLRFLSRLTRRYDERLTDYTFQTARAVAWYNASRLLDPFSARETRQILEQVTRTCILAIRWPERQWLRLMQGLARRVVSGMRRWPRPARRRPIAARRPGPTLRLLVDQGDLG